MKRIMLFVTCLTLSTSFVFSQSNTFPASGNVGIGTSSPFTQLHLYNNTTSLSNSNFITIDNRGNNNIYTTTHVLGGILFAGYRDVRNPANVAAIWAVRTPLANGWASGGDLVFGADDNYGTNISADNVLPTERMRILANGNAGIGTSSPQAKLDVNGNIYSNGKIFIGTPDANTATKIAPYSLAVNGSAIFTKAVVKLNSAWPDYVFKENYKLPKLDSLEQFIKLNGHLPEMPKAQEVAKNGIDLASNQILLLKKIEELTLIVIEQNKRINELEKKHRADVPDKEKLNNINK
jgi:hypothetical protein